MLDVTKRIVGLVLNVASVMSVGACGGAGYSPPGKLEVSSSELETITSQPFDETWQTILNHVLQERYMIEAYDKASGTMAVSFGPSNPSRFADCGVFGNHPLLDWPNWRRELNAVMTVRLTRISPSETQVVTRAEYIIYGYFLEYIGTSSVEDEAEWKFDSLKSDEQQFVEKRVGTLFKKWVGNVTCQPTHVAERGVIDAVRGVSTD